MGRAIKKARPAVGEAASRGEGGDFSGPSHYIVTVRTRRGT